jgi:hypothetical protein
VICLPGEFEGGALVVRQYGDEVRFDWGDEVSVSTDFKWAFLFGDCEHNVEYVTSGVRLTIAYDLYVDLVESFANKIPAPKGTPTSTERQRTRALSGPYYAEPWTMLKVSLRKAVHWLLASSTLIPKKMDHSLKISLLDSRAWTPYS